MPRLCCRYSLPGRSLLLRDRRTIALRTTELPVVEDLSHESQHRHIYVCAALGAGFEDLGMHRVRKALDASTERDNGDDGGAEWLVRFALRAKQPDGMFSAVLVKISEELRATLCTTSRWNHSTTTLGKILQRKVTHCVLDVSSSDQAVPHPWSYPPTENSLSPLVLAMTRCTRTQCEVLLLCMRHHTAVNGSERMNNTLAHSPRPRQRIPSKYTSFCFLLASFSGALRMFKRLPDRHHASRTRTQATPE